MDDTLVAADQLDLITGRFTSSWNAGDTPDLHQYLTEVATERQSHLLSELLPIEIMSRRNRGETPDLSEYLTLFPDDAAIVNRCFADTGKWNTFREEQQLLDTRTQAETDVPNDSNSPPTSAEATNSKAGGDLEPHHPKQLGNFRIIKKIGEGGMGYVFEAEDIQLNRRVALKVMKNDVARSASARQRFLREGRAVASLHDDHIIPIFQVGETDRTPFIAMPLLSGETLDTRVSRSGRFKFPELLRIAREIASGLSAAHSKGVIHRDIKPSNLWLELPTDRVKILDFGLARMDEESQALTVTGSFIGTPMYMSPEQADGLKLDARSDLFSFGAVLYFAATGESPFKRPTLTATLHAIGYEEPTIPHTVNPNIPQSLSGYIMSLMSKKPEERPSSATEVLEHLELILEEDKSPTKVAASVQAGLENDLLNGSDGWMRNEVYEYKRGEPQMDVDISAFVPDAESLRLTWSALGTVEDFINTVYVSISSEVPPDTYGTKWLLQDRDRWVVLASRKRKGYSPIDDKKSLSDVGVFPGSDWKVVKVNLKS